MQFIRTAPVLVPALLGLYALAFVAGGVYYLEQRVARIRDQFPERGPMAVLLGYTALGIGLLAAAAVAGQLVTQELQFQLAALVATASGVGYWITRIHFAMTTASRIRAALFAVFCGALTALTGWWLSV
jgi:hypothetical protein